MRSFKSFVKNPVSRSSVSEDLNNIARPKGVSARGEEAFAKAFNKNSELVVQAATVLLKVLGHFKSNVSQAVRQGGESSEDPEAHFYQHAYRHDQAGNIIGTNLVRDSDYAKGLIKRFSVRL